MSLIDPELRQAAHDRAAYLGMVGKLEEAEHLLRELVRTGPDDPFAAKNLSLVLLSRGNYREGAPLYDARLAAVDRPGAPDWSYPRWKGESLDGKQVLIWPEQGLGDQIMFARFAPELRRRGCDVTLLCHPALESLFRNSLDVRVLGTAGRIEFPDPDVWMWSNSLLTALVRSESDIPGRPYLRAPGVTPVPFRIGVATKGNPGQANDAARSLPPEIAAELLSLPGCGSLHPEDTGARDFAETASIIAGLDLVVSVCTSVAHLAGAMGKPCLFLLTESGPCWRWMRGREDSPWYPSARLIRQSAIGDWRSVLARVSAELSER